MKIKKIKIESSNVIIAEKIKKLNYNYNYGISNEEFYTLINKIRNFSKSEKIEFENLLSDFLKSIDEKEKAPILKKIKNFLYKSGIFFSQNIASIAIEEIAKIVLGIN